MVQQQKREKDLSILNENPNFVEGPTLLHELVPTSSGASAIEFLEHGFKRRKFSYQRLHALSDILARRIIELTATLEYASAIIPVLLPQCPELYIVLLGILKAGKAFCPLNLDIPEERLRFILKDVSADLVVTNAAYLDQVLAMDEVHAVCVDHELLNANSDNPTILPCIDTTDLAYVLYTSGSTGLPKAVSVSHRAVTQSLLAHDRHIPEFTRFLQFAAPTFDVSIFEIFFPWFRGRTLVGRSRTQMLEDLPGTIQTMEADAAELTPTVAGNLLQGRESVPGLKLLLTIGEMLTQHIVSEYGGSATRKGILWAMYGPTEAAIHCTLQAQLCASSSIGNIGRPLNTVSTFIVAPCENAVGLSPLTILPWGEEGELVLGGYQIAEEYLNRHELTTASFVEHSEYGRLYRTGDRARFCDDGTIECLGRIVAGQVKLRGQRVELGEVEQIAMKVEGCRMASAMIINETLVVFCATGSSTVSRMEILEVYKRWLPSFMIPSDVSILPSMPLLPSGKIDKRLLESEYSKAVQQRNGSEVSSSDKAVVAILHLAQECLGQKLSLNSNLQAAGLNSLQAIRLASQLRAEGYSLSAVDILALQTLNDLIIACRRSPFLDEHSPDHDQLQVQDLDPKILDLMSDESDIDHVSRCTPLQEAMLAETFSRSNAYCNWIELELSVELTYDEISSAISSLAKDNEILRSGFCANDSGNYVQVTWKDLLMTQVESVSHFQKSYVMDTAQEMLRPFRVQVQHNLARPRILVQLHHALYDGWSFDLLLTDLDKILRGVAVTPRPQFRDVSRYYAQQRLRFDSGVDAKYWADLLCGYVPTTLTNYNGEKKAVADLRIYRERSSINTNRLFECAHDLAINPQVFFQAATGYILGLYSGSSDVVFGNVTSGRTIPVTGIEDIVGPCIASLPCRMDLGSLPNVLDVLKKVQDLNRDSLRHCTLPLRDIARAAGVQPGTRLFDVLFVWQQSSSSENSRASIARIVDSADDLEFKLTLEFEPCENYISCRATFDPSMLPEHQIQVLLRQIDEIVSNFLEDTNRTMADVGRCFTTPSLSVANPNPRRINDCVSLSHAVEMWASTSPDKEAIIFGQCLDGTMKVRRTITYSVLNSRANQLARLLSQKGVGQDQLACILMEKSIDLYVAILAVLKLGSGYLPLVPDTPIERIGTILKDAQVAACISEVSYSHQLQGTFTGPVILMDSTDLSWLANHNLDTPYDGSRVAYAVFTSGSTGIPKGVIVTQRNLMSNLEFLSGLYPTSTHSRMLQSCSQAFDVSVFEIFFAWHVGMSLCTAVKEDLFRDFEASINTLGITHLSLTPTVAALVDPDNVPKVEFLVTAGEALTEHVRRQWAGRGLYQGYGPSETTNICTVRPSVTSTDLINNIGAPFDNTSAFVLDPDSDAILPRGAVGELCFGGEQVFRGYLNRPELNATKIINLADYGRVYRSGDMGRLLPSNVILSSGRSDDQVKIRGQRVELGEITSIVLDEDGVADCATLLLLRDNDVQTLVTFWVPKVRSSEHFEILHGKHLRPVQLQMFDTLSRQLPEYMVPSYLIPISKIPMTAQAKIDKRLLQTSLAGLTDDALTQSAPALTNGGENGCETNGMIPALSDWELSVAEILARILSINVEGIRRSSSFFNLGLDSVSAIRFCNTLRRSGLGDFTIATVLKNPTISSLGALQTNYSVSSDNNEGPARRLQDVFTDDQKAQIYSTYDKLGLQIEKINPCTPLQEAMLASGASEDAAYNNTMVFDLKGDVTHMKACWKFAQARHEILRTSFVTTNHSSYAFAQVVLKDAELEWVPLSTLESVQSYMDTIVSKQLLAREPPLCLGVHETQTTSKLVLSCHHALYDGIAIANLLEEIQQIYVKRALPRIVPYDRYLQHMISQDLHKADMFWSDRFTGFEPTYFPDLTGRVHRSCGVSKSIRRDLHLPLRVVRTACQRASVSILSVVQAAWVKLLHFYTDENDLCFGNVVSGRALPEDGLDHLVAPCFNTLPVRVKFNFQESNSALLKLLHSFNVESLAHQLTPLRRIQGVALKEGGRLFDNLVILQQPSKPLDETLWTLEEDVGQMDLPVVCEVHQDDQHDILRLTLHFNTCLLSEQDAHIAAETFDNNLIALIRQSDTAAKDCSGIAPALRAESNMCFTQLPSGFDKLHRAFEVNASSLQTQHDIALDFLHGDGKRTSWSYQELNLRANHIATRLIHCGVGLEDIVPIHISKSPTFYASILGVLKAGAAFAPVHPNLPAARKELMLEELNPKAILCTDSIPGHVQQTHATIVDVRDVETGSFCACEDPCIENLTGANLAYCLYTSGSTGVPKAVSMEHRSPIQTLESSRSLMPWRSSSRLLQYAAVTFDMCYYDCFLAWSFGFTLCAAEQHSMFNDLPHIINTLGVTLLDLTPSVAASLSRCQVPGVEWLYCIGEAMSTDVAAEWCGACVNSYGPTEAAFCTTMFPISEHMKTSVIGQPYPTTSFAVFSALEGQPLPMLGVGELYIGGAQLARSYLGRPELTDERFVTKCGQRFYKSGDMVRMLSDGNFEFIGRADDQVKIRGLRVELGEINNVLKDCDTRVNSVVTQILKKDATAKEQLVAFLATRDRIGDDEQIELREKAMQAAKDRLPAYMVPQFCLFVDKIPRSMAAKVDKKALSYIFETATTDNAAPNAYHKWTGIELNIRNILSELSRISVDDISPTATIYQLGLDSISAVQIAAALRRHGYNASASDVMRFNNCVDIAKQIEKTSTSEAQTKQFDFSAFDQKHRSTVLENCGLENEHVEAIYPCTPLQQGMISQFIAKDGAVYYNYLRLGLSIHDTSLVKLQNAWANTMTRHPILRTGFAHVKDDRYPFVMVRFTPDSVRLPWSSGFDTDAGLAMERLEHLQRKALTQLHQPMWHIRIIGTGEELFLDLSMFHALFDAHSLQLVFNDVVAIYNDRLLPETVPLEPILSEFLQLDSNQNEKTENFWTNLGKKVVPSRFPNLSPLRHEPRPSVVLEKRSSMSVSEVEEGCRAANTTLQSVGIASWSSIVSAYTGEADVTIGVVLSGRTFEMANDATFPCINTVPFPCTVTENKSTILKATMALITDMLQHQFIPLGQIQKLTGMPHEPLFDSLFAYQKISGGSQQNELWNVWEEKATTEYPISIELELTNEYLEYRLTYLPHIIPSEQANTILEQLDHIMQSFIIPEEISVPQCLTSPSLYSITPAEEPTLPSDVRLLHDFVELTATQHPDRVAFEFADSIMGDCFKCKRWTYCELDAEGNRIAHLLQSYDVSPGSLVAVCFDKCPEASFAILGVLKAGCAFVAIDPSAPSARQAFIVKDSGARAVLSMSTQSLKFGEIIEVPILDLDQMALADFPASRPSLERTIDSQDRSYCLYTSGTTGTPKACELTHENAVQAMLAFQRLFAGHWDEKSRWLQFASFHFDVSVLEQYWSWSVGICVVSAPRDTIFEDIANAIRTLDITHIDLTPSLAQVLHPDDVPSLCKGVFITGGESLKQEILDVWGPKSVIYNGYGPTEATIGCTMYPRVPANGKPSNIGPQFDNVGSYVLIPGSDIPVLRGAVGELCVSGKLVGKGYLNRPELTAERFPYLDRFKERVYRTGDLVRILHNGTFDFLGRADDQVKLRGQRLEIGEINSVIRQSSKKFADVATLVLKHPKQQKEQIVTFVAIGAKSSLGPTVLLTEVGSLINAKEACQKKLPPYMIPTHFVPLLSMPLNVNNKADGKKLKQFYEALTSKELQQLSASAAGPSTVLSKQEETLRRVLAGALSIDEGVIDRNSSFYELGMDSISVIGVSQALKQAGFAQATASVLLRHSTIGQLASVLSTPEFSAASHGSLRAAQQVISSTQHRYRRTVAQLLAINSRDVEALAPCTPLQQGMIARYLDSDDGLYFNTFRFSLSDFVDIARLRFAWEQVFDLTQTLRTAFVHTDDGYIQAVLQGSPLPWNEEIVREEESIFDCLERLKIRWLEANRMELNRLFEINLIGKPGAQSLAVHIFHGLYDGNSIELLFEWVREVYEGWEVDKDPTPTFHEALAYGPLRVAEGATDFWKAHLSDHTPRSFPRLTTSPVRGAFMVTRELDSISAYDTTRRKLNVTAQAIAQACWLHVLQKITQASITVGMVVSGRSLDFEGVDRVVGPMFNTIPCQHRTRSGDTWASVITRVHNFNIAALPYQHTPLRDIMKWCKRTPNQPLFDSLFAYKIEEKKRDWINDRAVWEIHEDSDAVADYPLAFDVEQKSNGAFRLTLVTHGDISDEKTSNELLDQFEQALETALADPSTILDISVSSNDSDLNDTAQSAPVPNGIVSAAEFEWTHNAVILREEISILTGVATSEITESTSIFELGLDSIDAIKLSAKLKKRDIQLSVSSIMRGLTIQKMCNSASDIQHEQTRSQIDREFELCKSNLRDCLEQDGVALSELDNVLPLTPLQEAMVAEMIASGHRRYYNFDVSQLAAGTDLSKLQDAWHKVIATSPILRTAFVEIHDPHIEGAFAQVVVRSVTVDSYVEKRNAVEDGNPDFPAMFDNLRRIAEQSKPLQPPFKVKLFKNSGRKYQVLAIAHALYDGWSLGLLHDAVHAAYYGEHTPSPSYEATLADILSGSGSDAAKFWEDYLTGVKPSLFSRCNTDPVEKAEEVHRREYVSNMEMSSITAFAKSSKVSLQTLGQTAFALTLASYVGSLDVTFGCVLSGRDDDTRSQLLFPTMNTVAIRTVLYGTRLEMLQYVQDNFNNVKQWQHFPLRKAIALTHVQGKLFNSLFIYQKQAEGFSTEEKLYDSIEGQSDVEYPICVEMEAVDGQLIWRCAIKEEVLSSEGARLLLKRLDDVLCDIVERSDCPTIDSTPQGTSVCGLSVFEEDGIHTPEIDNKQQRDAGSANVPLSETATKIRHALAFVSQIPEKDITRDMTIFHIGLDSISAIKVSSVLRKQGIVISVGEMLKAGTVEKMAELADMRTASTVDQDTGPAPRTNQALSKLDIASVLSQHGIEASQIDRCLPITAGQLYMLSMWLNTQGANFYPEFVYDIKSSQSFETLQKSWQALVRANPILRTRIVATKQSDVPYIQVVLRQADALLVDITGQDAETATHSMDNVTGQQPWVHAFLAQTTVGWTLKLRIHHVFYDGVSLPHLLRQFMDICSGASSVVAEDKLDKYIVVAHTESAISSRRSFWKSYLEGVRVQLNPGIGSAPESKTEIFKPGFLSTLTTEAFARQHGVSVQALFLATYAKLYSTIARGSDRKDVVIGIYLANRSSPIANLLTAAVPTVNLVPLRVKSPLSSAIHDTAAQIQRDLQDISNPMNAAASLYEISEWTGVKVDTFVNFLTLPDTEDEHVLEDNGSKITPKEVWQTVVSRVTEIDQESLGVPQELINEHVNAAYLHAIDIEATIRNGHLDIGVFAPTQMLSLQDGEKLVDDMRLELENLKTV